MLGEGRRKRKAQEAEKKRLDTLLRELGYVRQRDIDDKKDKERKKRLWNSLEPREKLLVLRYLNKKKGGSDGQE